MRKTISLLTISFCLSLTAFAQDAVVIELSQSDAVKAKQLYEAKLAADKAWDDLNIHIITSYQGFAAGATYSKDFRFIVPKSSYTVSTGNLRGTCFSVPGSWVSPTNGDYPYSSATLEWRGPLPSYPGGWGQLDAIRNIGDTAPTQTWNRGNGTNSFIMEGDATTTGGDTILEIKTVPEKKK